ncbi:hypothetical protein H072_3232 [Dactylellina haptotyla CBS 200.50]|uniref:Gfd2/YDR514C-like C-terminal domain-containing protein n=1 Tax=Dactylellina haptotyla (strain CBS 200.50) TaxID=1284197 RepID=S8AP58_DACHA|nr:hypothetical protein H072_3232 [Dactylellina haptotyla CBS 200.50]
MGHVGRLSTTQTQQTLTRDADRYVVESSESGCVCDMVVPFDQVRGFFERTQIQTAVNLSATDPDLILDPNCESPTMSIRFVGTSRTLSDYELLSKTHPVKEHRQNMTSKRETSRTKSAKSAKSETKRQAQIQNRLKMLKSAREIVTGGQDFAFFSIDVESWEKNHDIITEVGITRYLPRKGGWMINSSSNEIESDHIIIKEHRFYKNGDYVADASGNFEFGDSRFVPLTDLKATIASFMKTPSTIERQFVLVGHDVNVDIEYLRKLGYDLETIGFAVVFDTVEMWKAMAGTLNGISLNRLCGELNIPAWNLHNAGNDARYTMTAFLEMATRFRPDIEITNMDE